MKNKFTNSIFVQWKYWDYLYPNLRDNGCNKEKTSAPTSNFKGINTTVKASEEEKQDNDE